MNEASLADMKVGIADTCLVAEEGGRPRVLHDRNEGNRKARRVLNQFLRSHSGGLLPECKPRST